MNMLDGANGQAQLVYGGSDFQVVKHGAYVVCAVTGVKIPLESLRYWSEARQEAYVDAAACLKRTLEERSAP